MTARLEELALRCERATDDQQGDLIILAFHALNSEPESDYQPRRTPMFAPDWSEWSRKKAEVYNFVQHRAFLDAASALVPPLAKWSITAGHGDDEWQAWVWLIDVAPNWHTAATPALALTAACLRAHLSGAA